MLTRFANCHASEANGRRTPPVSAHPPYKRKSQALTTPTRRLRQPKGCVESQPAHDLSPRLSHQPSEGLPCGEMMSPWPPSRRPTAPGRRPPGPRQRRKEPTDPLRSLQTASAAVLSGRQGSPITTSPSHRGCSLCALAAQDDGSVVNPLLGPWRCTSRPDHASSLSSTMGLTTILTTIWVCPPKYAEVQNPYF